MTEKTLTIVIPVYKTEEYIKQCVDSVLSQTYKNLEVILVDDGSPDNCPAICDGYAAADPRVRVIHKKNEGLFAAVGEGIESSTGDYIGFVDSDDWVESDMFEVLMEAAAKDGSDIAVCSFISDAPDTKEKKPLAIPQGVYEGERLEKEIKQTSVLERPLYSARWNKIFRRELILPSLQYGKNNISLGEDIIKVTPCLLDAQKVSVLSDKYLYHYRCNPQSITRSKFIPNLGDSCNTLYCELLRILCDKGREALISSLKLLHANHLLWCIYNQMRSGLPKKEIKARLHEIMADDLTQDCIRLFARQKGHGLKTKVTLFLIRRRWVSLFYFIKRRAGE